MRIGIVTYHCVPNFGAQLQAFSTVSYLRNRGYEPVVINWYPEDLEQIYKKELPQQQICEHEKFTKEYLPVTKLCRTEDEVISVINEGNFEGLIFGSDANLRYHTFLSRIKLGKTGIMIMKQDVCSSFPNPLWGCFAAKLNRRIPTAMMSASGQGTEYYHIYNPLRKKMGVTLLTFDYFSARDYWTQKMVSYLTRGQILSKITPDPVFGFNQNAADSIPTKEEIISKYNLPDKYLLLSFARSTSGSVSEQWVAKFDQLAQKSGYTTVAMYNGSIGFKNNLKYNIDIPLAILDWYALIKYSQGYVGHRMHPIIISLHNAIPFFSFDTNGLVKYKYFVNLKSSKIYHILKDADFLPNRCNASARLSYKEPSPEMVFEHIMNFDREKCQKFSDKQLSKYLNMMNEIENTFKRQLSN